jgi:hypothetical protein
MIIQEPRSMSEKAKARKEMITMCEVAGTVSNCMNCEHWDKQFAQCDTYKQVPPPHILIYGCPEWEHYIPF